MTGRSVGHHEGVLTEPERSFLASARRAVLVTIAPDGRPRPVPICFVVDGQRPVLCTPIDDKPKRDDDPLALARVRDIRADPRVTVLVDRWNENWTRLAWLRCDGRAIILEPTALEHPDVVAALRAKYPQYTAHHLETRPIIRIEIERATSWGLPDPR
jgi:PPOX class probable F420-dependent enzyme